MKTQILLSLIVTAMSIHHAASQEKTLPTLKGKLEFSPAFTFSAMKIEGSESERLVTIPIRLTYFLTKGMGIGGEVMFTSYSGNGTGIVANLLLEGDLQTPNGSILYVLGGYGLSNGSAVIENLALKYSDNCKIMGVLNLGTGVRFPVAARVLAKTEFRYQYFSGKESYTDYYSGETYTDQLKFSYLNITFGIALLL